MNYSPLLSIVTATFEISAAVFALYSRGRKNVRYAAAAVLLFLAAYQVIEAVMCVNPARFAWLNRPAFMTVLWLPATGLLLLTYLAPTMRGFLKPYTALFYTAALGIFAWQLIDKTPVGTSVCLVVFARYNGVMPNPMSQVYGYYYQLGLLSMLILSAVAAVKTSDDLARRQIGQVLFGCLAFIIPAMVLTIMVPSTEGAYASILCHMALFLAVYIARVLWMEHRYLETESITTQVANA
jgi:hypothetical protein